MSAALARSARGVHRPLTVIFTAVVLAAVGIGLVFPILPALLRHVTHVENVAPYRGWVILAVMPVFALSGLGVPALQALATRQVDERLRGQFQGVLASAVRLASIVCPLAFSSLYVVVRAQ